MLCAQEKRGAREHPDWMFQGFREVVEECSLIDLPVCGYQFTWARARGKPHGVEERLDRGMVTGGWLELY
ncbi:hypothetical protein LINGRAHAP2_LOCUS34894 [Linum grandiflorum]